MQVEFPQLGQSCKLTSRQLRQLVGLKVKSPQLKIESVVRKIFSSSSE